MFKKVLAALGLAVILAGCDYTPSSDDIQNQKQEQLNKQAVQAAGMPAITHFWEKKQLRDILEMRDKALTTYTYIVDMNGNKHKFCDSIGFGIPYATQYTNPMQGGPYTGTTVPQADPNGLYSPADAEGTWVLCLNPKLHKAQPVYVEPRIIVSPFEL
jgi:hypothetical protein